MCRQYVILHHTDIANPHFDVMFETAPGSVLATWRSPHWPPLADDVFTPLAEHRRDYLDCQGPLSGNRGKVRRVARGICRIVQDHPERWVIELDIGPLLTLPRESQVKK